MDFLNKAFAQLNELFRSMTVGARITAGLLLVVVVVSLVYLFRYETSSPDLYLMGGEPISAAEITAMRLAFGKAGLNSYVCEGDRIRIPRGQQHLYMAALADSKALPNSFFKYMTEAVAGQSGFSLEGKDVFDAKKKLAWEKDMSLIIGSMTGIQQARVVIHVDTKRGLVEQTLKTALVTVKPIGSGPLDESVVPCIRYAVAAGAGMKPSDVTVLDLNGRRTFSGDAESGGSPGDAPYYAAKRHAEQVWRQKILGALSSYVPGASVAVNVELEKELRRRETEQKPDAKPVPYRKTEKTRTKTRDGSTPAGRPGFQANQPQALATTTGKGSHEEEEDSMTTEDSAYGTKSVETEMPGLTPTRVTASIGVPTSYFERVWRERNPTPPGEQAKSPSAVVGLLPPLDKGGDAAQLVTVTEFQDITAEPVREPGMTERTLDWLVRNWSTLGLIFLGMFSLVVLRSMIRAAPAAHAPPKAAAGPESPAETEPLPQETPAQHRLRRLTAGGPTLRDELSELVAEDPDAAANVLRTWIGTLK
jgi:flagellar M-ring protein FliF